jgi:putative transcriptional regulator
VRTRSRYCVAAPVALVLLLCSRFVAAQDPSGAFFLVASPSITDPTFRETVVLIVQHTPMGTRGLIINRPLDVPISRLAPGDEAFEQVNQSVFFGGPVALPYLRFVFRAQEPRDNTLRLMDDVYLGESGALLKDLFGDKRAAGEVRIYAGHAGWGPGQLQSEIEGGGWFAAPATAEYVFHEKPAGIWSELVKKASLRSASASERR